MKYNKFFIYFLITLLILPNMVYAKGKSNNSSSNIIYNGNTTITSNTNESNKNYSSTTDLESALLVTAGTSTLNNITINKTGDASGDDADFYGTNAGILVYNATLNIKGGTIITNGSHANAVFAYSKGTINISDATINTTSNNSGGLMATGGGVINANNLTIETKGNSSAPIRSDRGGGTITVNGGTYTSNGVGSPAIYSTADISVNNAKLVSKVSSGVVIEGDNSITLNNTELEDTNIKSNSKGEEENFKNIFIYQSTSGDAKEGTGTFSAKDSKITTNNGSTIFVTNTKAVINLENNTIINNDKNGNFLTIKAARWGKEGSNGGSVNLNMINEQIDGDIILDNISTLDLNLSNKSVLTSTINSSNEAKYITLTLSNDSIISLTGDSYINELNNEDNTNSNIYLNGYKLYVGGKEVSANNNTYENKQVSTNEVNNKKENSNYLYYIIGAIGLITIISFIIIRKNK